MYVSLFTYWLYILWIQLLNPCRDFLVEIYYSKDSLYFVSFRHDDPEKVFSGMMPDSVRVRLNFLLLNIEFDK